MSQITDTIKSLIKDFVINTGSSYSVNAYLMVYIALTSLLAKPTQPLHDQVSAQALCNEFANLILQYYGPFSREVLKSWGVRWTKDIGIITFQLVQIGILCVSKNDSLNDFIDVFDFKTEFDDPFTAEPPFAELPIIYPANNTSAPHNS